VPCGGNGKTVIAPAWMLPQRPSMHAVTSDTLVAVVSLAFGVLAILPLVMAGYAVEQLT
jgi:hypothetical protein